MTSAADADAAADTEQAVVADPAGAATSGSAVNDLGQPVGLPVAMTRPARPSTEPMDGRYCRVESLDVDRHGPELFEAFSEATDDGDWTYLPYGPFAAQDKFIAWLSTVENKPDPVFFTIIDRSDGCCVGLASYLRIDPVSSSIEVGHIHLARRLQRTPAATEAMYLLMKRAFDGGFRRYEWKCDDLNGPSRSAAGRLGFRFEGIFLKATRYKGRNRDTAWYAIVDDEWPMIQAEFERWLDPANFDDVGAQRTKLTTRP